MQRAGESLSLREHGIELLDELVGWQPAVRDTEIHRPARGDDADADLPGGLHLGLDQSVAAAREDVVVVEDGRAARERELGDARASGGVLCLGVDPRPDRIELAQPGEEIGLLRPCACEGLVEVVVRVDESRRDDRAAEFDPLVARGRVPVADGDDRPSVDEHPAGGVLGAGVVHRDDPAVRVEATHSLERDELEAVDVDEPAVGDLQARDHREREERQRQERCRARPAEPRGRLVARPALLDHLGQRRVREQPGDRQRALGEHLPAVDGDDAAAELGEGCDGRSGHVLVAHADDDEVVRVVGDARSERAACSPEPETKPSPIRPVARCRSTTAILARSRPASATARPFSMAGSGDERLRDDLIRHQPDRAHGRAARRDREALRRHRPDAHRLPHPVGHAVRARVAERRAPLEHEFGTKRSRSGSSSRSAW